MGLPIETWLAETWLTERDQIAGLPFVTTAPELARFSSMTGAVVCIKVDMPAKGPVCKIKDVESVVILFGPDFPISVPVVLVRPNFPAVPHLAPRTEEYRTVCLTMRDKRDWWVGRTLLDVVKDVYRWLCDAAAGTLIKNEDPFEPLIASGTTPVELSVEDAKRECAKYNWSWKTTSVEIPIKDGEGARYVVGKGDVPTQVWYQKDEQSQLWIDPPESKEELLEMMASVGFDRERVEYWIDRGRTHLLMVVGVRRGRHVSGKSSADEWVAFELRRKKAKERCLWDVNTHIVLESFSQDIARLTSGFKVKDKRIILVGAGALGSEVCESIARSGTSQVVLIDNDTLQPHNLARHTLNTHEIGEYKADALAKKVNFLYDTEICTGIHEDFFDISMDRQKILDGCDCIIDCSASSGIQARLGEWVPKEKPILCGFQVDKGNGTVLLYSPNVEYSEPAMLEAILVTELREEPLIARWMKESGTIVELGGGCSSISSLISSSVVKLGSGWLTDRLLRMVESGNWPTEPFIEILEYHPNTGKVMTKKLDINVPMYHMACGWRVFTTRRVFEGIEKYAKIELPNETGGVLIGRLDRQRRTVYITEAWKAPKDSCSTRCGFSRGLAGLKNKIAMLEKDTNEYLSYVGEWHSHPPCGGTGLSSIDSATAKRMATELEKDRIPAVCLITDSQNWDTHVVDKKSSG